MQIYLVSVVYFFFLCGVFESSWLTGAFAKSRSKAKAVTEAELVAQESAISPANVMALRAPCECEYTAFASLKQLILLKLFALETPTPDVRLAHTSRIVVCYLQAQSPNSNGSVTCICRVLTVTTI
jgi:hypothetical protein